jgi:hypothetical protein
VKVKALIVDGAPRIGGKPPIERARADPQEAAHLVKEEVAIGHVNGP